MGIIGKLQNSKKVVLSLIFTGWILDIADRSIMGFSIQFVGRELNLDPVVLGLIMSSFYLGYAIMQVPAGWFADKFGAKNAMITSITLWSLFTGLTAAAWSATSMIAIRFLFGCCQSGFSPGSAKTVAQLIEKNRRGRVQSLIMASNPLGVAIAPIIAVPIIVWTGWRGMFVVAAVAGFALAVLFWIFMRPGATPNGNVASSSSGEKNATRPQINWNTLKELLRTPIILQLCIMWFGISTANKGLTSWLPSYLLKARHLNLQDAGIASSLPFFAAVFAMLVTGWLMDKYFENREKYLVIITTILASIFLYLTISASNIIQVVIFQVLAMIFIFMGFTVMMVLPLKVISTEVLGLGNGIIQMGGQAAGIVAPSMMGLLVSAISYDAAFWYLIGGLMLACVTATTIKQKPKAKV